jgi:hypothetical protein
MTPHSDFRFSITVTTDDLAVVYALRALSDFSQATGNSRITWGGTKDDDWMSAGKQVTFRFSKSNYRDNFVATANRLLLSGSWRETARNDNDPASPQG